MLADVLVSLIITSLVIGVLLAAASQSTVSTQRTGDQYRAISYARSKLAELRAAQSLVEGVSEGRFDDLFSWSLTVGRDPQLSLAHEAAALVALDVELKVSWRRGVHRYERPYRTMMLRPKRQTGRSHLPSLHAEHASMTRFKNAEGFSLAELLVALALLGMISALIAGGLGLGNKIWHRSEEKSQATRSLYEAEAGLARCLAPSSHSGKGAPAKLTLKARRIPLRAWWHFPRMWALAGSTGCVFFWTRGSISLLCLLPHTAMT